MTGARRVQAAFVYPNPRSELVSAVASGEAPDTALLGQNHLAAYGIDAHIHEPRLRHRRDGPLNRLTWNARELSIPWELRADDVVVTPLFNLLPLAARIARRPRVVLFDWGLGSALARASRPRARLLRAALGSVAAVACPSAAQREHLVSWHGLDPGRVHTVELGADERFFATSDQPCEDYVLAVGKDLARDYATLAAATAEGGFRTIVVAHTRNVEGLTIPPSMEVRHDQTWAELRELYARAACVALPLRHSRATVGTDGSGLTAILEAMACGKPVVATHRPALETYLQEGQTGAFVSAEDASALAEALSRLLEDEPTATALGAAGREAVEQRFTTRSLAARLAPLIESAASGRG